MSVIGFLTYQDFIDELSHSEEKPIIRVDSSRQNTSSSQPGMNMIETQVTMAAQVNGDILVANFVIGRAWSVDEDRVNQISVMADAARSILARNLTAKGYYIRKGIIGDSDQSKTRASAGPWTLDDLQKSPAEASAGPAIEG